MSKYHPLDVRHPANRDLRSKNFLLDPPTRDQRRSMQSAQRPSGARQSGSDANPTPQSSPANPWGERGKAAASGVAQVGGSGPSNRQRRRVGPVIWVILIAVALFVLSQPQGLRSLSDLTRFATDFLDDTLR